MNAFEYRPKVGLFLKKIIAEVKSFQKMKVKKVIQVYIYCK